MTEKRSHDRKEKSWQKREIMTGKRNIDKKRNYKRKRNNERKKKMG